MARPEKVQAVEEISRRFRESSSALLTEYRGLTVTEIAELRGALREANTDYKVLKNTLARIAAKEAGLDELAEMLEGPTAVAFIHGDAVDAAKALDDAAKKFPVLVIKGGVLDGKIVSAEQATQLAKLEPREVQLAKIVMMVNAPLQQTVNVFSALLRDFGSMLAQVVAKKESGELPGGPGEAPAAEAEATEAPETTEAPSAEADQPAAGAAEAGGDAAPEAAGEDAAPGEPAAEEPKAETDPDQAEVTDGADPAEGTGDAGDDQSESAEK